MPKTNDLASLKLEFEKFFIDELETTSVDLSKLSDVVKNEVVKETEYDKLVKKVNAIQTPDTSNLFKKLTMKQKLKRRYLIMIMINISLLKISTRLAHKKLATKVDIGDC